MELRIEELLDKYWKGETSLEEEKKLKMYFRKNPSLTNEGRYFSQVGKKSNIKPDRDFVYPGKKNRKTQWSVAAAITVGILASILVIQDAKKQREFVVEDPKEAYEITRRALLMISTGLNEGKNYSRELTNINKAEEILKDEQK